MEEFATASNPMLNGWIWPVFPVESRASRNKRMARNRPKNSDSTANLGGGSTPAHSVDILGRVFEYFLTIFASANGSMSSNQRSCFNSTGFAGMRLLP